MSRFKPVPKSRWSSQFFSVFLPASCIVDLAIIREFNGDIDGLILLLGAKYVFTAFILLGIRLVSVAIRRVINRRYPSTSDDR